MTYNAACPGCGTRHRVAYDTRGWIDIVRCKTCPPPRMLNGLALALGDSGSTNSLSRARARAKYRQARR